MKVSPDGTFRESSRYLLVGREGAGRPDPVQAAWLYAQMVRWGQAPLKEDFLQTAMRVFRPDLYDAATGHASGIGYSGDHVGEFTGRPFDPTQLDQYLSAFAIARR